MKNLLKISLSCCILALLSCMTISAKDDVKSQDVTIGQSGEITMIGTVEPTIISVTMPSYIPFNMSKGLVTQNKVVSPRITIKNNSSVPVRIMMNDSTINLGNMSSVLWNNNGTAKENEISVGFKLEEEANKIPNTLKNTFWCQDRLSNNQELTNINSLSEDVFYVVGTLGKNVPENSSFNVTTFFSVTAN